MEELIFRGFLFKAIAKNNVRTAIIVSSLTFALGHIINLFNGSGLDVMSTVMQICLAVALGFLFVTIFYRSGSLVPCIVTHQLINISDGFAAQSGVSVGMRALTAGILIVISVAYACFVMKSLPAPHKHSSQA
ncbi:CPBP family intramembrane glutamic endopeptidase [Alloscardovia criceti]|uniref:CPBP family intramembrane glutamic endopeptidase n=1 Tax=Alloscardovia criceti TaxID=356828 RepID=UPI00039C63AE|nr:CPBP family intramembrane glutamic endopeptidase [Alloscardovia criceti]